VLGQLDQWLDGPGETGWVVVTGGPGMGKSAILSAWLAQREAAGAVVPHHFVRRQVADWDQPEVIAVSLAAQIEAAFPALRDAEAKPERRLLELLGRVSKQLGATRQLVVVVDGLDEARAQPGENPLPRFLPHVVPAGIRFLCATRPTYPHLNWIEARSPVRRLDLDDPRWASSNEAVVRGFWEAIASEYQPPLSGKTMDAAIARAEGNVLHAVMLHDALRDLPAEERRADRIPRGLKGLIGEIWDRAAAHEAVRVGLGLLCAAQEALSLDVLAELAGWSYDDKQRFVRDARQLLLEEPASWAGVEAYRPRHDWVRELIAERLGAATVRAHHETLSRTLATWPARSGAAERQYALRHALIHRAEAGEWANAWQLAADMCFLEAKCRELGVHETEADVSRVAERCRASDDVVLARRFGDLARVFGRESHRLRAAPEMTPALVWNRLRRSGWSMSDLDQQLRVPASASFLRVRHAVTRESPALLRDLVGHAGSVTACTVTADGRRVVSASEDRTLKVWDLESGRVLSTLEGHAGTVTACAVTVDGRRVVSASEDRTLRIWDLESGRALATLAGHAGTVTACAVTADGRHLISASEDGTLKVWDLESRRTLSTLAGHTHGVTACAVTADGRRVVSASGDRTLKLWDLESGSVLVTLAGHTHGVTACAVTADGRRAISASEDRTLKVWNLANWTLMGWDPASWAPRNRRELATLDGHTRGINGCAVTADGRRVVSASEDHTLKVWDLASWTLKVWDLESWRELATLDAHTRGVKACAVTSDGRRVVSASEDRTLKIWDLASGHALATRQGHISRVMACAVTPDGRRVVSASEDLSLKVWDFESGRALATLEGHISRVTACAVTPDGHHVISASRDRTLKIWDLEIGDTIDALATLEGHTAGVMACAVAPDGRRVASASADGTLKIWDFASGRALTTLEGHSDEVMACAVTADGRRVVSASADMTLKIWDLESGRALATLRGHTGTVMACAVTADSLCVVSASADGTLKLWDLGSGRPLATLQDHTGTVMACAVTADGRCVISASEDGTLKVWNLETHACLLIHRGDAPYSAIATSATAIVAGDSAGGVWFLEWPR
jgi:WD40 repeat protein